MLRFEGYAQGATWGARRYSLLSPLFSPSSILCRQQTSTANQFDCTRYRRTVYLREYYHHLTLVICHDPHESDTPRASHAWCGCGMRPPNSSYEEHFEYHTFNRLTHHSPATILSTYRKHPRCQGSSSSPDRSCTIHSSKACRSHRGISIAPDHISSAAKKLHCTSVRQFPQYAPLPCPCSFTPV